MLKSRYFVWFFYNIYNICVSYGCHIKQLTKYFCVCESTHSKSLHELFKVILTRYMTEMATVVYDDPDGF